MPLPDAVTLTGSWKVIHNGRTDSGPLVADDRGLAVDVSTSERKGMKKITTTRRVYVVSWEDVTNVDITQPQTHNFGGSTINANTVELVVETTSRELAFTLKRTSPVTVRNQLGPYLSRVKRR